MVEIGSNVQETTVWSFGHLCISSYYCCENFCLPPVWASSGASGGGGRLAVLPTAWWWLFSLGVVAKFNTRYCSAYVRKRLLFPYRFCCCWEFRQVYLARSSLLLPASSFLPTFDWCKYRLERQLNIRKGEASAERGREIHPSSVFHAPALVCGCLLLSVYVNNGGVSACFLDWAISTSCYFEAYIISSQCWEGRCTSTRIYPRSQYYCNSKYLLFYNGHETSASFFSHFYASRVRNNADERSETGAHLTQSSQKSKKKLLSLLYHHILHSQKNSFLFSSNFVGSHPLPRHSSTAIGIYFLFPV